MQPQKHDYRQIKILPESLANQIAAGEVIERPSSVVKELIENSIDAGATQITIEIQEGGKSLIRIRDNGKGIAQHDLELALATHATSKIYTLDELEAVASMGFRGEALASIASVAKLKIISKYQDAQAAWQINNHTREVIPAAHVTGTTIEVCELFIILLLAASFLKKIILSFYIFMIYSRNIYFAILVLLLSLFITVKRSKIYL